MGAPNYAEDALMKHVDDLMWHVLLGDIAEVDKVEYTSLPPTRIPNPKAPGAGNPLIIRAYTFIPKNLDRSKKQPLIVFCHQGIHANEDTSDAHVFRELIEHPRKHDLSLARSGESLANNGALWLADTETNRHAD